MFGSRYSSVRCFFPNQSYTPKQTVAFPRNVAGSFHERIAKHQRLIVVFFSARPNPLGLVGNVDLDKPLEFGRYAKPCVAFVERFGSPHRGYFSSSRGRQRQRTSDP
jgi:hypothetical protein